MEKVKAYVEKNYKRLYGDKQLMIQEHDHFYTVRSNKDESPLLLSKAVGE